MSTPAERRTVRVNIIGKSNGVGLARDLNLLSDALQLSGHQVSVTVIDSVEAKRRRSALSQLAARVRLAWERRSARRGRDCADINLMLEHVWLQYLPGAKLNVAVPNPEWFDRHDQRFLGDVDCVWAKTGYTRELFRSLGCDTTFIGFDSYDRYDGTIAKQRTYFHLAGKSTMKGTDRLLRAWAQHPQWPRLIVIQHKDVPGAAVVSAPNIERRVGYLSDAELMTLQNQSVFHICLSLTEGWGHYIVEALSAGAVTITVDAAPMNELVTPERGVLVPYQTTGTQRLATTYQFDAAGLEAAITRTIAMSDAQCAQIGANARAWFLANKQGFSSRLEAALQALPCD